MIWHRETVMEQKKKYKNLIWKKAYESLQELLDGPFNPSEGLLEEEIRTVNYHTGRTGGVVHRIRDNAEWLPILLSTGTAQDGLLAVKIFDRILKQQDKDYHSRTYGIWPYLFEEPLHQMKNPDWNWAAFIGRVLITLEAEFGDTLDKELKSSIKEALLCACESIERRNMSVDYTNISLMTSFVLVKTGELYDEKYYYAKGVRNLKRQLDFAEQNGGFSEYNSPAYGVIDIEETGRMLRYFHSEEARRLAEKLHAKCWEVFAHHFHFNTGQIAPPHARCYEDLQSARVRSLIYFGTLGQAVWREGEKLEADVLWPFIELNCPRELVKYFAEDGGARMVEEEFYKEYDPIANSETRVLIGKGTPSLKACTFLHPKYCLGTFRKHDMWNQRRPVMAYLGGPDKTVCFRTRCLHDGMDYSSAVHTAMQDRGRAACGISFVKDHGDYHYILTPLRDGSIILDNLCIEFTLTGAVQNAVMYEAQKNILRFDVGSLTLELRILETVFGGEMVETELIDEPGQKGLRLVLCRGSRRKLDFNMLDEAYIIYTLEISEKGKQKWSWEDNPVRIHRKDGYIHMSMDREDGETDEAVLPVKPGNYEKPYPGLRKLFKNGGFFYYEEDLL